MTVMSNKQKTVGNNNTPDQPLVDTWGRTAINSVVIAAGFLVACGCTGLPTAPKADAANPIYFLKCGFDEGSPTAHLIVNLGAL